MSILENIKALRMQSRHQGMEGKFAFNLYTTLLGKFERVEKNITDEQALKVIKKMIKDAEETIQYQILHGADCSAATEEVRLLSAHVPVGLPEIVIRGVAQTMLADNKPIGAYMGAVKSAAKSNKLDVDMKLAQKIWMEEINKIGE